MELGRLWLTDFRNYRATEVALAPAGLTVVVGDNGQGKTNLLEAIGWLATMESFRSAPAEALVRDGAMTAVVRGEGMREGRALLIEGEIARRGRSRILVNRQPLRRSRELFGLLRTSVFAPDDLVMIKGGPAERRRFLDGVLVSLHPRWDAVRADVERIVRQRTALVKQAGPRGSATAEVEATLDVWDDKLIASGTELADGRAEVMDRLGPLVNDAYCQLSGETAAVEVFYAATWRPPAGPGLGPALAAARRDDLRRGITSVGPHRDDLLIRLSGLPARTHASQGEQRTLALALRLGAHALVAAAVGEPPLLLLDDVFSELDESRQRALVRHLPAGQAVLTTAGAVPAGMEVAERLRIHDGAVGAP